MTWQESADAFNGAFARYNWHAFLWDHLGADVSVTFDQAGIERTFDGKVRVSADGSYSIGELRLWPDTAGIPIRWALR